MWMRRGLQLSKTGFRSFSSAVGEKSVPVVDFRTSQSNPSNHTENHIGRLYTIDPALRKTVFHRTAIPKTLNENWKTFVEMSLMIREPAVQVINILNKTDYSKPVNRFVFYGEIGLGKTSQLLHLIHYGYVNNFIIVHIPWLPNWYRRFKEKSNSFTKEGMIDLNVDAATWLIHFKTQNGELLKKLDLKCSKEYVWSQREVTPAGSSLLELIEHGINRVKYATDTLTVLIEEIKAQSTEGKCRTMVAIDGYNAFFMDRTKIKFDSRVIAKPEDITITHPFLSITKADWCNGVCLLVVDKRASFKEHRESPLPKYQLQRKGFEHLDPFIPINVEKYNDIEFTNMVDYYVDRKWISNLSPGVDEELKLLSGRNGFRLKQLVEPL